LIAPMIAKHLAVDFWTTTCLHHLLAGNGQFN